MTGQDVDRFTELLCSRLCHDLISPLGAVNNGVEILAERDAAMLNDAIALIGASARKATAKLTYFRLAFGAWGSDPSAGFGTLRKAADQHFDDKKCPVVWSNTVPADAGIVDKEAAKLLLNLLLVAAECAQRDAKIEIAFQAEGARPRISISIRGERCKLRDDVRSGFAPALAPTDLTVRNVIAHHCRRLCDALGLDLAVSEPGPNAVEFKVS